MHPKNPEPTNKPSKGILVTIVVAQGLSILMAGAFLYISLDQARYRHFVATLTDLVCHVVTIRDCPPPLAAPQPLPAVTAQPPRTQNKIHTPKAAEPELGLIRSITAQLASARTSQRVLLDARIQTLAANAVGETVATATPTQHQALARIARGDVLEGLEDLMQDARTESPEHWGLWRRIGAMAYGINLPMAREAYAQALALGSNDPWVMVHLGRLDHEAGDFSAAVSNFTRAMESLPRAQKFQALIGLGSALEDLGAWHEALDHYQEALPLTRTHESASNLALLYLRIGSVFLELDDHDNAHLHLQSAFGAIQHDVIRNPGRGATHLRMVLIQSAQADLLAALGTLEDARTLAESALPMSRTLAARTPPEDGARRALMIVHSTLGGILKEMGEREEALQHYQDSLALAESLVAEDPGHTQAWLDLAFQRRSLTDFPESGVTWAQVAEVLEALESNGILALRVRPQLEQAQRMASAEAAP